MNISGGRGSKKEEESIRLACSEVAFDLGQAPPLGSHLVAPLSIPGPRSSVPLRDVILKTASQ